MGTREDVLNKINRDLNIVRYDGESKNEYLSRIIYSALSMWVRYSTLDHDFFPTARKGTGVSKKYVIYRCKPFLKQMLKLFPESRNWFYPQGEDSDNPITIVRDRLYHSGQLLDVGFKNRVGLPEADECAVDSRIAIRKGVIPKPFSHLSGLAQIIVQSEETVEVEKESILNFFGLMNQKAQTFLKDYLTYIRWHPESEFTRELFNKYSEKPFSSCWSIDLSLENNDITLFRNGSRAYGFIKKEDGVVYTSYISDYFIRRYEVRRWMYGLKKDTHTTVKADLKKYPDAQLFELQLYSDLPIKEKSILLLIGWPKKHISDHLHLLFHESVWEIVKLILHQLHIDWERRTNG